MRKAIAIWAIEILSRFAPFWARSLRTRFAPSIERSKYHVAPKKNSSSTLWKFSVESSSKKNCCHHKCVKRKKYKRNRSFDAITQNIRGIAALMSLTKSKISLKLPKIHQKQEHFSIKKLKKPMLLLEEASISIKATNDWLSKEENQSKYEAATLFSRSLQPPRDASSAKKATARRKSTSFFCFCLFFLKKERISRAVWICGPPPQK